MINIEQKVIDAAREFGHVAEKMHLSPEELLSALHMAISGVILAKHKRDTFQNIQLL